MVFTKGIIDCYINIEEVANMIEKSHTSTPKIMKFLEEIESPKSYYNSDLNKNEELFKSFHEVILVEKILFIYSEVDHYIIYQEKTKDKPIKIAIVWSSDANLVEIVDKVPDIIKKFFKSALSNQFNETRKWKKNIKRQIFNSSIKYSSNIIINKSVEFYAFFKKSETRDRSIEITNFKVDIQANKIFEKDKIISLILLVISNFIIYLTFGNVAVTTTIASIFTLAIYLITNYFCVVRNKTLVNISSLTFNEYDDTNLDDNPSDKDELLEIDLDNNYVKENK